VHESIVKVGKNGEFVALGTIIDADGFAITKASEVKEGKLFCRLADGRETFAQVIGIDEENDVALLDVCATDLKAIEWAVDKTAVGQWAVTPGLDPAPEAVGIVSVPARRIRYPRAIMGVQLDFAAATAKIRTVSEGFGAEKAGLKPGDEILSLNNSAIKNSEELYDALAEFREGDTVDLKVRREGEEFDARIRLKAPQPEMAPAPAFDRQARMNRMGSELSQRAEGFAMALQHDTVLQPWQCGGPLLNLDGKAIGLNIARAGRVATYALPAELAQQVVENLKAQVLAKSKRGDIPVSTNAPAPAGRQ
jgi:serine protease Do